MELREALDLLQIEPGDGKALKPEALRRQYLKLALRTHPDKNPGDPTKASAQFQRLGAAYALVLQHFREAKAVIDERERTSALLDILLRALIGDDVEQELQNLGEYRPPAAFGVNYILPFDSRVQPPFPGVACSSGDVQPDVRQALRDAFLEDGLTEDGDPLDGYVFQEGEERGL